MQKSDAIALFGNHKRTQEALGVCRKTFWNWPDPLTQGQADQVVGAYMRITEQHDRGIISRIPRSAA